jgi:hypothetical protein
LTNLVQQLDEWQDYVDDEELRLVLASAAAALRKPKRKTAMARLVSMFCLVLIALHACDINTNTAETNRLLRKADRLKDASFTEVERRKLQDLEAALDAMRVSRE